MVFIIRVKIAAISSGFLVASCDILPSFSSEIVICRSSATLITVLASASGVDISYSLIVFDVASGIFAVAFNPNWEHKVQIIELVVSLSLILFLSS